MEKKTILFFSNGYYKIEQEMLFEPPIYNKKLLYHIYNSNLNIIDKLSKGIQLNLRETKDLENLPSTLMICYLNGFEDAKQVLIDAKEHLRPYPKVYASFKDSMRVLRKMKYNVNQ